jgi:hypothetical protein
MSFRRGVPGVFAGDGPGRAVHPSKSGLLRKGGGSPRPRA